MTPTAPTILKEIEMRASIGVGLYLKPEEVRDLLAYLEALKCENVKS